MKVKHGFYLLLALPLLFAACDKGSEDVDNRPAKEYAAELTLTSEATMDVAAEAGDYEITYTAKMVEVTRTSPVPEPEVEAACAADWVTIGAVDFEKAAFSVAANEGEAREAKIVVKYSTESFEVTVKQAAKEQGKEPEEPVTFEAVALAALYEAGVAEGVDSWFLRLADKPFTAEGALDPEANVYVVDLYLAAYEGEWSATMTLPAGEYNLNAEDSIVAGTFGSKTSGYMATGAEPVLFEAGNLVVTEAGMTLTVTIDGVEHIVTYEGDCVAKNEDGKPVETIEAVMTSARRIGTAEFGYEVYSYDFPIVFEGDEYVALIYLIGDEADTVLQAGEYVSADYSIYLAACGFGNDEVEYELAAASATVAVAGDVYSFDVTLEDVAGVVIHFTYEGEVEDMDPADDVADAFVPAKVVASRDDSYPAGNFFLQLFIDDYRYHDIEMYDRINPNDNYLSSGKYTMADGSIGDWSTFSNGVNTSCEVSDAEITLVNNSDSSVTLVGFIKSAEGHYITIDWTGTVEGFR